jgi:ankyrin repeat protein
MTTHPVAPWRTLPERPNLEQLKNQAKDLLRDYLAGEANAVAEVNRAERSAPSARTFSLADAQRVLARAYGIESWAKLKQKVEGVTVAEFHAAAGRGDIAKLREFLGKNAQLVKMEAAGTDERIALHHAVLNRQPEAVRFLMAAGSDARKGVYPNRDATTPIVIATDRGYDEIVQIIEEAEQHRREDASCPNATVTPEQDRINVAIKSGKTDDAIALLSADETLIKACDRDGASPLHIAAEACDLKLVEWLLVRRASVTKTDLKDRTPLDRAVYSVYPTNKGSFDRFKLVGPRLRAAGSPLTLPAAIALGEGEFITRLHRENPKAFVPVGTFVPGPLGIAVRHKRHEVIRLLLDLGLDVNETRRIDGLEVEQFSSGDPLWHAAQGGDYDAAVLLLDRGADPNAGVYASGSPTGTAFSLSDKRMQQLMVDRGGKVYSTAVALRRLTDRARRLLAGADADSIVIDDHPGDSLAVQLLWGGACGGDPEIVRMALQHIDWPPTDPRWFYLAEQPLRIWNHGPGFWTDNSLPRQPYVDSFRLMLTRVDANLVGRRDETLLHRVASDGTCWGHEVMTPDERVEFAKILLDAGARFDARDELLRTTPLGWAARWGRLELVELYLSRGCPVDEPAAEPWASPIAWAKRYRHDSIVARLESVAP